MHEHMASGLFPALSHHAHALDLALVLLGAAFFLGVIARDTMRK